MSTAKKKESIYLEIDLDENNNPESIRWSTRGSTSKSLQLAKSFSLSIWDNKEDGILHTSSWSKDMLAQDMKWFYLNILACLAKDVMQSTNDSHMEKAINELCNNLSNYLHNLNSKQ